MTTMTETKTHILRGDGVSLTYDVREGDTSLPTLFLIGSPMGAGGFVTLASHFTDRTVVTYDPRGVDRSPKDDPATRSTPEQHADDLRRIISELDAGPVDVFGRSWQIHTMLGFVALTLIGAQVIQLGVFARTYALVRIGEHDPLLDRLGGRIRLEHGLLVGGGLVVLAIAGLIAVGVEWASEGFETLGRAYETALLATMLGLGIQIVFGAFFLALLVMPLRRDST